MADDLAAQFKAACDIASTQPAEAVTKLQAVITDDASSDAEAVKVKEQALAQLSELYVKQQDAQSLRDLLQQLRPFFGTIPKAKTAKIVRGIIDSIAKIPGSLDLQVLVCQEQVAWAKAEKRTFLRQRIELRLATLQLEAKDYQAALALISTLLSEVKKLDDKLLLVDIHLLESRVHHALRNMPKARAALTAARTAANAIYVPVMLQAEIDMQSGVLHAEEKDYKTSYSYFFEAFEQFSALDEAQPQAVRALKCMLLAKIMLIQADDVPSLIAAKAGLKFAGREVDAMRAVAKAYQDRSLQTFQDVLAQYPDQLVADSVVASHLTSLYDTLLGQNLVRLIEPFSRVEIAHVAKLIGLPVDVVERKLSQMILDKAFAGTLDQGAGCLEVFEEPRPDGVYPATLDVYDQLGRVVDTLFARSQKIVV